MRRRPPDTAYLDPKPVPTACAPDFTEIPEHVFHKAKSTATALANTMAGESFAHPGATYVRVNHRHFCVQSDLLTHAESLRLLGESAAWHGRTRSSNGGPDR